MVEFQGREILPGDTVTIRKTMSALPGHDWYQNKSLGSMVERGWEIVSVEPGPTSSGAGSES